MCVVFSHRLQRQQLGCRFSALRLLTELRHRFPPQGEKVITFATTWCAAKVSREVQLAPASQGITDSFKRFLLLAGGSKPEASEGSKGSLQTLYLLDAFKECLGLICYVQTDNIVLADLLCSLSLSVSNNETSGDDMTFTARLLDVGMTKVYSLNRQMCVIKLPTVFVALRDIMGSEHEEAIHAAVNTFKSLIHACLDETLIKQGVDQIVVNGNIDKRKSGTTITENLCATIENLVDYHYTPVLDLSFQVVSAMFDKLGVYSSYFMRGTLKSLADMEKLPDEDFPFRKQLHECLGTVLVAMGPETFLGFLPLNLEAEDLSELESQG